MQFEDMHGTIEFEQDQARWQAFSFKYLGVPYTSTGSLAHFKSPDIDLDLSSRQLFVKSKLSVEKGFVVARTCSGRYLDSLFSIRGSVGLKKGGLVAGKAYRRL